jgi:hypothetical protein
MEKKKLQKHNINTANKTPSFLRGSDSRSLKNWFHIDVALWQHTVHVFIGTRREMVEQMPAALAAYGYSSDQTKKVCDDFGKNCPDFLSKPENGGDSLGSDSSNDVFVRLNSFSYEVSDLLMAMHECLHAANGILVNVGLVDNGNKEGLAYTQEFLYGSFLRQYIERNTPENYHTGEGENK